MPQTVEAYKKLAQRDLELIEAQRDEIAKLKAKNNKLEQALAKARK
jgi:cell division protein FtsB